jgi:hypothetical protein
MSLFWRSRTTLGIARAAAVRCVTVAAAAEKGASQETTGPLLSLAANGYGGCHLRYGVGLNPPPLPKLQMSCSLFVMVLSAVMNEIPVLVFPLTPPAL